VLDGDGQGAEGGGQAVAELLEGGRPARVVVSDANRVDQDGLHQAGEYDVGWPRCYRHGWVMVRPFAR
jgi:hypothetical protein